MTDDLLIEVKDLEVFFPIKKKKNLLQTETVDVRAVDGVSFDIRRGETVGLVGESGSGKTTVGRAILRAIDPTGGEVTLHIQSAEKGLKHFEEEELRHYRQKMREVHGIGAHRLDEMNSGTLRDFRPMMSLVFQDPYSSLNPRMTVRDIIAEPLVASGLYKDRQKIDERVREIAKQCKLNLEHLRRFPHAFSGGQRQRICIARALVTKPDFVVCDESVSALDVSIQAEIVNLLKDIQADTGVSFLFIAHDLSVVAQMSDKTAVMYVGKFMEYAPTESLFFKPRHPYTHALLSAIPHVDPNKAFDPVRLDGEIPNPLNKPSGCRFHTRCPYSEEACAQSEPNWEEVAANHFVACHRVHELDFSR